MNESSTPLDRYHDRNMAPEEAARFEAELARSPELRAELAAQRALDAELRARFAPAGASPGVRAAAPAPSRSRRRAFVLAAAALVLVASALAWRAWSPAHRAPHASPPEGCATWSAWVARAATPDLVACTTQPVDVTAPLGPVSVDGALFLPMGWRAEALEAPIAPGVAVFRVTARDGRIAILLVASDEAGSPVIAEEPGLAVARRVVAGRSCTELALSGPPFVLGALSGGR